MGGIDFLPKDAWRRRLPQVKDQRAFCDGDLAVSQFADGPTFIVVFDEGQDDGLWPVPLVPRRGPYHRAEDVELLFQNFLLVGLDDFLTDLAARPLEDRRVLADGVRNYVLVGQLNADSAAIDAFPRGRQTPCGTVVDVVLSEDHGLEWQGEAQKSAFDQASSRKQMHD